LPIGRSCTLKQGLWVVVFEPVGAAFIHALSVFLQASDTYQVFWDNAMLSQECYSMLRYSRELGVLRKP
jgi:hypothetical protein